MFQQYLLTLDDDGINLVTNAIQDWCKAHHLPLDTEPAHEAMRFAVGRVLEGEKSPVALSEAIKTHMRIAAYRQPPQ